MHPILGSRIRLGAYLLGWVPVFCLQILQYILWKIPLRDAIAMSLPAAALGAFLFLSSGYLCRALPLGTGRPWVFASTWGISSLVMGGLWSWLTTVTVQFLSHLPFLPELSHHAVPPLPMQVGVAVSGAVLYLAIAGFNYVLIAQDKSREAERTEQDLRVLAREAELKALRAQLNPHFLFNSLNSISALTTLDPKRAREMCVLLSDFLRKSLKLGERSQVCLSEELDLLRSYLSIEQIRFGSRLSVEWSIAPGTEDIQIPTLLLQPLVENAIKHGIAAIPEGGTIRIGATRKGGFVEFLLENPVDPDAEAPQGLGMGLRQVKMRLQGRYGSDIFFEAALKEGQHKVLMVFPTEVPE